MSKRLHLQIENGPGQCPLGDLSEQISRCKSHFREAAREPNRVELTCTRFELVKTRESMEPSVNALVASSRDAFNLFDLNLIAAIIEIYQIAQGVVDWSSILASNSQYVQFGHQVNLKLQRESLQ